MTERLIRAKSGPGGTTRSTSCQLSGLQVLRGDVGGRRGERRRGRRGLRPRRGRRLPVVAAARRRPRRGASRAESTRPAGWRPRASSSRSRAATWPSRSTTATSSGSSRCRSATPREADRPADRRGRRGRGQRDAPPGPLQARRRSRRGRARPSATPSGRERIVEGLEHAAPRRADAVDPSRSGIAVAVSSQAAAGRPRRRRRHAASGRSPSTSGCPMPFERARTLLLARRRSIGAGRRSASPTSASTRRSRPSRQLGAPLWAERARAELGRIGLRPRAPDDLTETERRVAELAATGLSSRQIAEQAFLAPKTVGNVLGRVYAKLGHPLARSRSSAASDAADGGARRSRPGRTDRGNRPFRRAAPRPDVRGDGPRPPPTPIRDADVPRGALLAGHRRVRCPRASLASLDRRRGRMTAEGTPVEHVGSILMPADQVVFSLIPAADEAARPAAQRAGGRPARPHRACDPPHEGRSMPTRT